MTYPISLQYLSIDVNETEFSLYSPVIVKLSDINLPAKKFSNVVLPDPEVPKIAVKEFGGNIPV